MRIREGGRERRQGGKEGEKGRERGREREREGGGGGGGGGGREGGKGGRGEVYVLFHLVLNSAHTRQDAMHESSWSTKIYLHHLAVGFIISVQEKAALSYTYTCSG